MSFFDDLVGGLGQLGTTVIDFERARNQQYPEQNQPQVENPQTPASATAIEQTQAKIFGVNQNIVLVGAGVLGVVLLVLAVRN